MNYQDTLKYLYEQLPMFHRIGAAAYKANLDNTLAICRHLGNPENKFKSIHIAGTNGKGSSSHMLAAIYQQAGYKVGLYTSPHLKDFRERIKINGRPIGQKEVVSFVQQHREAFEKIKPSFFEWTVGLAFDHFSRKKVDVAIVEVGLGGRLDSTNVVTPLACLITNIGFDHMALLGNTLRKIAAEKAGIIKPGVPVVISETQKEIKTVFTAKAGQGKSPITFADKLYTIKEVRYNARLGHCEYQVRSSAKKTALQCDLSGTYQARNLAGVLATTELLQKQLPAGPSQIKSALKKVKTLTGLRGRWDILQRSPLVICDTGHNEDGIREVVRCVDREYKQGQAKGRLHVVFGAVNDKDLRKIFGLLKKNKHFKNARYYFCKPAIPRGMPAEELLQQAQAHDLIGASYPSVKRAISAAKGSALKGELVFIGGSTFTVAEAL